MPPGHNSPPPPPQPQDLTSLRGGASGGICVFITLMGLIGYINDELQRRSKEIAIRKVNGAESFAILEMLGSHHLKIPHSGLSPHKMDPSEGSPWFSQAPS